MFPRERRFLAHRFGPESRRNCASGARCIAIGWLSALWACIAGALALKAALLYGAADFPGGLASRKTATGLFFIMLAKVQPISGLYPLLSARITSVVARTVVALAQPIPLRVTKAALPAIVFCGGLDMGANALYVIAAHDGPIAIVAVLTSFYPARGSPALGQFRLAAKTAFREVNARVGTTPNDVSWWTAPCQAATE